MPVVAILSFALESNVFNPVPRRLSSFQRLQGEAYERDERQAGFVRRLREEEPALFEGVAVRFVCLFRGWCGGLVPASDFALMKRTAAQGLRAILDELGVDALDGVYLDLHGAMGAEGCNDAEAELVESMRDAVPVRLVSASFDLHGNFSERLAAVLDMVAAYKTVPHVDMEETKTKALRMLLTSMHFFASAPAVVVLRVPAILPGETVITTEGLGRHLYRWLRALEPPEWRVAALTEHLGPLDDRGLPVCGLWDASFFVGHGLADEPRVGAAVVLTGGAGAVPTLCKLAREIGQWYWDRRAEFGYPSSSPLLAWPAAVDGAYAAFDDGRRALIGDLGDHTDAGGSGDVPFALRRLLELASSPREAGRSHPRVLIAGLVDRVGVEACQIALEGGRPMLPTISVGAGHATGTDYGEGCEPLRLHGVTVLALVNGGEWAVLQASPTITLILQRSPWAFFGAGDVERLTPAFHPGRFDVVVVKRGNVESLAVPMLPPGAPAEAAARTRCLTASTPGASMHPPPPRPRLRPGVYPASPSALWTAPVGQRPPRYRGRAGRQRGRHALVLGTAATALSVVALAAVVAVALRCVHSRVEGR
mmetsp:Transcript_81269/g.252214  ORF Transcript_81269/g.252214 Transcript_81269/m.252214 type:complete len:594 (-) Transcript_81269:143-1924(-)